MKRPAAIERNDEPTLNDRFTRLADRISEWLGAWWFSAVSLLLLALWTIYGAIVISQHTHDWFTSSEWNFPLNTITTCGEWLLAALCAAAANRIERRNRTILDQQTKMLEHNMWMHEQQLDLLASMEALIQKEEHKVEHISNKVDDIVE